MLRCANVTHCDSIINARGSHVRLNDRTFCSADCALEHADAERRLAKAAQPFKDYSGAIALKWSQEDYGDVCDTQQPFKPPR